MNADRTHAPPRRTRAASRRGAEGRIGSAGLSPHALALTLRLPASRISQIVRVQRAITPETALRLARYFGGSAAIWLRLQIAYDLSRAETELADRIAAEVAPAAA